MNVVGKVGSLISQGVYSVATPFHPFGGAVDVIVVQQEDGTYRSTPWYVRFGKFQGVLKSAEKVVSISVNGVETGFHMYLDNSGQAYFMREVSGSNDAKANNVTRTESDASESSIVGNFEKNTGDRQDYSHFTENHDAIDADENLYITKDEQASPDSLAGSSEFSNYHYGSLDEVEDMVKESDESNSEMVLISVDGHVLTAPISSNDESSDNVQLDTPQFHLGPGEGSSGEFGPTADVWEAGFLGDLGPSAEKDNAASESQLESPKCCQEDFLCHEEAQVADNIGGVEDSPGHDEPQGTVDICYEDNTRGLSNYDMFRSCLDLVSHANNFDSQDVASLSTESDLKDESRNSTEVSSFMSITLQETAVIRESDFQSDASDSPQIKTDGLKGNDYDDCTLRNNEVYQHIEPHISSQSGSPLSAENVEINTSEKSLDTNNISQEGHESSCTEPSVNDKEQLITMLETSVAEEECSQNESPDTKENISSLVFEISLCGNLLRPGIGHKSAEEAFEAHRISEEEFKSSGASIIKNGNLIIRYEKKYLQWDKAAHIILGKAVFGSNFVLKPKDFIPVEHDELSESKVEAPGVSPTVSRRWRLWPIPFRMSKSLQHTNSNSSAEELFVDIESGLQNSNEENMTNNKSGKSPSKKFIRTNIPTNEEIASLNLKEGQNMIAFSFSTRVFGRQQVDAHIYLWKWNARIVISDVDGTITKSDVLGQFMPLVGKDWTQSGVARLFSAIKENGYQLLFLSARAIVQAYLTRSFLLNLKQDGKALPTGPVVISPDGLFPSLYREVVRRAPHEFKIACLEDIKALFPSDYNPFYAGFGNRDTDELSYRKIGIPKGKIFIINPKGEVAINHCVDVKSYTSLHTLVHDMFPPTTLVEQEDYNSWNYWKMPLPSIDM